MAVYLDSNKDDPKAVASVVYGNATIYLREEYKGCVLSTYENNGYNDSDWYANVWDEESQSVKSVFYATTRFGCNGSARVDASEEVRAKAKAYYAKRVAEDKARADQLEANCARKDRQATVKVAKGKWKHLDGQTGTIFWFGRDSFKRYEAYRVGVQFENGDKVFFEASKVTVVGSEFDAETAEMKLSAYNKVRGYAYNWSIGII